ncbi:MAG: archease [Candidatus Pacearchaeota archaeon]
MYKFLPHTADALFEVKARSLEQLFVDAAKALNAVQVELKTLEPTVTKEIHLKNESIEMLLYDFLQELVFIKDTEQLLFKDFKIKIIQDKGYELCALCYGAKIDMKKQTLLADVKAITFEEFRVWKENNSWRARVLVDI